MVVTEPRIDGSLSGGGPALVGGLAFAASAYVQALVPSLILLSIAMLGLASMLGPFWTLATSVVSGLGAAAGIALINSVGNIGGFIGRIGWYTGLANFNPDVFKITNGYYQKQGVVDGTRGSVDITGGGLASMVSWLQHGRVK